MTRLPRRRVKMGRVLVKCCFHVDWYTVPSWSRWLQDCPWFMRNGCCCLLYDCLTETLVGNSSHAMDSGQAAMHYGLMWAVGTVSQRLLTVPLHKEMPVFMSVYGDRVRVYVSCHSSLVHTWWLTISAICAAWRARAKGRRKLGQGNPVRLWLVA